MVKSRRQIILVLKDEQWRFFQAVVRTTVHEIFLMQMKLGTAGMQFII
jgi:hypothetical protein